MITISNLTVGGDGWYVAHVTDATGTITVDNRIGPWTTPVDPHADNGSNKISRHELVPEVSAKLRELVALGRTGGTVELLARTAAPKLRPAAPCPHRHTTDVSADVRHCTDCNTDIRVSVRTAAERIAQQMAAAGAGAVKEAA